MKPVSISFSQRTLRGLALLGLAAAAWALSGIAAQAQARDQVHWSIGVHSPGVHVGVSNAPPVVYGYPSHSYRSYGYRSYGYPVYEPRPVVVYPRPVVVHPRPVIVQTYPVYVQPEPWGHRHGHRHGNKHRGGHGNGHGHGHRR